jgi:hypothetical protein
MRQDETEEVWGAAINHFMDRKITTLFTSSRVLSDNDNCMYLSTDILNEN